MNPQNSEENHLHGENTAPNRGLTTHDALDRLADEIKNVLESHELRVKSHR